MADRAAAWGAAAVFLPCLFFLSYRHQPLVTQTRAQHHLQTCGHATISACMQIVAIESQKGGSGKTLTALNLAVAATLAGRSAAVIDLDPQASAAGWYDSRSTSSPAVVAVPPVRLPHA